MGGVFGLNRRLLIEQPVQESSRRSPRGLAPQCSSMEVSPQSAVKLLENQGGSNRVNGNVHRQLSKQIPDDMSKKIANFPLKEIGL